MTLTDFFNNYYWPLKITQLRECTLVGYESSWRLYVQPKFGDWEMTDIKARDIEQWLLSFDKPGAAKKSYNLLRPILRTAIRYDFLEVDPTQKVEYRVPKKKYIPPTLSKNELNQLLEGFRGVDIEAWLLVAASTGVRKEEGAALNWEDIDLRTGAVKIDKGAQWVNGKEVINPPKTQLSYRTIYLPEKILKRLREIAGVNPKGRLTGRFNAGQIGAAYKRRCQKLNLPYIPPKCLRHTWATIALAEGVPLSVVSRNLGHYDVSTTARYYIAPKDEELIKASEIYNNVFK